MAMTQSNLIKGVHHPTISPIVVPFNTTLEQLSDAREGQQAMAMLALSHTVIEQRLYETLLAEVSAVRTRVCTFSLRQLMTLTQLLNYSSIRRGIRGLVTKLSIEQHRIAGIGISSPVAVYLVFTPAEIFARRAAVQFRPPAGFPPALPESKTYALAIERLAERHDLSRREAQVSLCCAQGLTNAQIGDQLCISEQTVKFHLRHIFAKYGVKRRAELISRLLAADG
jgi:DNA-binding CsgD family transcriptional regulator